MAHPISYKKQAVLLRESGKTHREIAHALNISVGTAFLWVDDVHITPEQKSAIETRRNRHYFTKEEKRRVIERLKHANTKYSREDLLEKIRLFYNAYGRIPLKREFNAWREYSKKFGSWNNAIAEAGFETNPVLFAKKFKAKDGHICDSFSEKIIDDWLFENGIEHRRHVRYGRTKLTADFVLESNTIVEFFGLAGVQIKYDAIIERKREVSRELGQKLVEIYPRDLFPKNTLPLHAQGACVNTGNFTAIFFLFLSGRRAHAPDPRLGHLSVSHSFLHGGVYPDESHNA